VAHLGPWRGVSVEPWRALAGLGSVASVGVGGRVGSAAVLCTGRIGTHLRLAKIPSEARMGRTLEHGGHSGGSFRIGEGRLGTPEHRGDVAKHERRDRQTHRSSPFFGYSMRILRKAGSGGKIVAMMQSTQSRAGGLGSQPQ